MNIEWLKALVSPFRGLRERSPKFSNPAQKKGRLVVTFYNTYHNPHGVKRNYEFILFRESDPDNVIKVFKGELAFGDKKTYIVSDLAPGNYRLVGLRLADPTPGNARIHSLMIYSGQDTVYDVTFLRSSKWTPEAIPLSFDYFPSKASINN